MIDGHGLLIRCSSAFIALYHGGDMLVSLYDGHFWFGVLLCILWSIYYFVIWKQHEMPHAPSILRHWGQNATLFLPNGGLLIPKCIIYWPETFIINTEWPYLVAAIILFMKKADYTIQLNYPYLNTITNHFLFREHAFRAKRPLMRSSYRLPSSHKAIYRRYL